MDRKTYTLEPGQKVIPVKVGTADLLVWGDLITREQVRISAFLNTLAEEFVPFHDVKALFLAAPQQEPPVAKSRLHLRLTEILAFWATGDDEPLPEETETRRYEPVEVFVGPYRVEGSILKSPLADLLTMLLVAKESYLTVYQASIRHVGKPWLGAFPASWIQVRFDRLVVASR